MVTLPARGDFPLAFGLAVLDGLDGVMNNDMAQVGATGKGIVANLLQPLGNVDSLQGVEILECVVLDFLAEKLKKGGYVVHLYKSGENFSWD